MYMRIKKFIIPLVLISILALAGLTRVYKLDQFPPSLSWDETAVGYNAWTIANWGKDEWGNTLPLVFKSFLDDKHPVHIYLTAFFVKIFGLSDFTVRFSTSFFGILNVLVVFALTRTLFRSSGCGLIAAFLFAVSPYAFHFSRFNHELSYTIFFFMLGLFLFIKGIDKKDFYLSLSFISFGISLLAYQSALLVIPGVFFVLFWLYFTHIKKNLPHFVIGFFLFALICTAFLINPTLLGGARAKQTMFSQEQVKKTLTFKVTSNLLLGKIDLAVNKYLLHFSPDYLFLKGDDNARLASQYRGQFVTLDAVLILLGILFILIKKAKTGIIALVILLLGPIPASFSAEAPHASRAMFMLVGWQLTAAFGLYNLILLLRRRYVQSLVLALVLGSYIFLFKDYLDDYFNNYSIRYAIDWQYGMRDVVNFVETYPKLEYVYMTNIRSQPYIFYLYYLKTPLPDFLSTATYNREESKSYNLIWQYDKYIFEGWNPTETFPSKDTLYVVGPSDYDGLRYKQLFNLKKVIKYPNGTDAFFILSGS